MIKNELIEAISNQTGLTKSDVAKVVDSFCSVVTEELAQGGEIQLVGFGKFEVVHRAAREGRNPKSGEKLEIPAKKAVKFRAGKNFSDAVA